MFKRIIQGIASAVVVVGCLSAASQQAQAGVCSDSKNGVKLAYTAYNTSTSDKKKYIPSNHTYVTKWTVGSQHAYLTTTTESSKTVCHYSFRGLKKDVFIRTLKNLKKMGTKGTCKSQAGGSNGTASRWACRSYGRIRTKINADIASRNCDGGIRLYGHSMGGAIAVLMATDLWQQNATKYTKSTEFLKVYTYGAPRVFVKKTANYWQDKIWVARWVYQGLDTFVDHVPSYPSKSTFKHFGQAYRVYKKRFKKKRRWGTRGQDYAPKSTTLTDHEISVYYNAFKGVKNCK